MACDITNCLSQVPALRHQHWRPAYSILFILENNAKTAPGKFFLKETNNTVGYVEASGQMTVCSGVGWSQTLPLPS